MTATVSRLGTRVVSRLGMTALAAAAVVVGSAAGAAPASAARAAFAAGPALTMPRIDALAPNKAYAFSYPTWNGRRRTAVVVLPGDYVLGGGEALPCVLNPHARNTTPLGSARLWRDLPTRHRFMVICGHSCGRRDPFQSWSVPGQISDLAALPAMTQRAMPWLRIDEERLYVVGGSMGGQETLSLLARYPDRYAGVLCMDGLADLARRYRELPKAGGDEVQADMRREVGGTPRQVPFRYRQRSPITFARTLATCRVPLAIWWSEDDVWVINQPTTQTGYLCRVIRRLDPAATLTERMTSVDHGITIQRDMPLVVDFLRPGGEWRVRPAAPARWSYRGWMRTATLWGHRFLVTQRRGTFWRVDVAPGSVTARSPAGMDVRVPYPDGQPSPATVVVDGVAQTVSPHAGTLEFRLRAGTSTALINPSAP